MRDLELRGAGNILGTQQSGHIATVGYELYCALLEKAVKAARGVVRMVKVDIDQISRLQSCYRAACRRFWADVSDASTAGPTREATIGDESHFLA